MEQKYSWWHPYRWFGRSKFQKVDKNKIAPGAVSIDTSLPGIIGVAGSLRTSLGIITPLIPREYIDLLFTLSVTSPLISETVYDSFTLANSGHKIRLEGAGEAVLERAAESLNELAIRMHPGGADGWINVAIYQLMVAGALSHEWVIGERIDEVVRSKFVPVQSVKFHLSEDPNEPYIPFQHVQGMPRELNTITYHYRPLISWENNPYGIPPMFAAIEPVWVMREVMGTVRGIAKKFGLLGLFEILLERPDQDVQKSETDEAYHERLKKYLADAKKQLEQSFSDGILIGYKEQHEFKHNAVTGDARGLSDLNKQLDNEAMSGANTDPSMHGRDSSRTETQIRQVYQKLVRQLDNIRQIVSRSLEYGYALHLLLAGFPEITVSLDWNAIDSLDRLRDEEVTEKKIMNARMLYEDGIISQEERSRMLGFDTPDEESPRQKEQGGAVFVWNGTRYRALKKKSRSDADSEHLPEWPEYHDISCHCNICSCESSIEDLSNSKFASPDTIDDIISDYYKAVKPHMIRADNSMMAVVRDYLRTSATRTTPEAFSDRLYRVMSNNFEVGMQTEQLRKVIDAFAEEIYREALLGSGFELTMGAIAGDFKPIFDVKTDTTTLKFLQETDFFYLGKFVKRGDTADRIQLKIINEYIAVGKDFSDKKFVESVADIMGAEYWQAERVIRTTSNISRNFGSIRVMEQSQVVKVFEIVGPLDSLTCPWCEDMAGREFRLAKTIMRMRDVIAAGPENLPNMKPFVVSGIPVDELTGMTDADVAAAGFDTPPYHPGCRHRIVAAN